MNLEKLKAKAQKIAAALSSPPNMSMTFKSLTGPGGVTTNYSFEAIVRAKDQEDTYLQGSDAKAWRIEGRLVSPRTFPAAIKHLSKAEAATLDGKKGSFTLHLKPQNPWLEGSLGDRFEGIFNL